MRPEPTIEAATQKRSLVLIVEDHPINRTVLTRQVNQAGFALEVAVDGQEAFEKWQSGRYALILADLHMPRMDGYQLTKAVRDWERAHEAPRTPILMLTANDEGGEAERFIELGMDDYLIKPVTIPLLAFKLHQWMPHVKLGKAPGASPSGAPATAHCPLILAPLQSVMDVPQALHRLNGKEPLLLSILQSFLEELPRPEDAITAAVRTGDVEAGFRRAHTLKGVAVNLALTEVAEATRELEKLLCANSCEGSGGPLARLEEAMARFRALAAPLLTLGPQPLNPVGQQGDSDPRRVLQLLLELDSLLRHNSYEAKGAFERLGPFLATTVAQESLDSIQTHMNRMDFGGARRALQPLVEKWQASAAPPDPSPTGPPAPEEDP